MFKRHKEKIFLKSFLDLHYPKVNVTFTPGKNIIIYNCECSSFIITVTYDNNDTITFIASPDLLNHQIVTFYCNKDGEKTYGEKDVVMCYDFDENYQKIVSIRMGLSSKPGCGGFFRGTLGNFEEFNFIRKPSICEEYFLRQH